MQAGEQIQSALRAVTARKPGGFGAAATFGQIYRLFGDTGYDQGFDGRVKSVFLARRVSNWTAKRLLGALESVRTGTFAPRPTLIAKGFTVYRPGVWFAGEES